MTDAIDIINQATQIIAVSPNEAARLCSIGRTRSTPPCRRAT